MICFKILSVNLHVIPYHVTKFQTSSLNAFLGITLTKLQYPNFQRAITETKSCDCFSLILPDDMIVIIYQLMKFLVSSYCTFRDIALTKLPCLQC